MTSTISRRVSQIVWIALACSHNLLVKREWEGVAIHELVQAQLAPFLDKTHEQLVAEGPSLLLSPEAAQNLGLALHELATNASKYGALSRATGRIAVGWKVTAGAGAPRRFQMYWRESGGPEVKARHRPGFGSVVIKNTLAKALAGEVELKFEPEGLVWQVTAPADKLFGETAEVPTDGDTNEETFMTKDLLRGQRILVVEDDAFLAMTVDDMLRAAGADVVGPAATLDSARQHVAQDQLSAAILDIRLNGDEVWPVARLLANSDVPFVFYTGHFDASTLPAEWAERPILSKPARTAQILDALADLVSLH
jgi:two-component system, chemotaxis family, sensor kinase Cph1